MNWLAVFTGGIVTTNSCVGHLLINSRAEWSGKRILQHIAVIRAAN